MNTFIRTHTPTHLPHTPHVAREQWKMEKSESCWGQRIIIIWMYTMHTHTQVVWVEPPSQEQLGCVQSMSVNHVKCVYSHCYHQAWLVLGLQILWHVNIWYCRQSDWSKERIEYRQYSQFALILSFWTIILCTYRTNSLNALHHLAFGILKGRKTNKTVNKF